jgi:hypothetical protein
LPNSGGRYTAAIACPARIARAASPRSFPRVETAMPGAAARVWTNSAELAEWSRSTTVTDKPRTTAVLKA